MAADLAALKAYVEGPSGQAQAESTVLLHVTHSNLHSRFLEIRFDLHTTVDGVKEKLRTHCGTAVAAMRLLLMNWDGAVVASLDDGFRPLGFYSPEDGYTLHIIDLDPTSASAGGWLEDTSLVPKYTLSEEAYNAREKTYRKFREEKRKTDPTWTFQGALKEKANSALPDDYMEAEAAAIDVGRRCEVDPGGKRGEVCFVGRVEGLPKGFWVGVRYDEPVGKNDGSINGKRYFESLPSYGGMVRPDKVKVGDYPPVDEFDDDDEI